MAAFNKFNAFVEEVLKGTHQFDTDVFKLMLSLTPPNSTTGAVYGDITQIAASGGYVAGGQPLSVTLSRSGGVAKVTVVDETFTATGGTIGPFRYGTIYNDSAGSKNLVGWFDHGSNITLNNTETFTADFDTVNGLFTLA